MQRIVDLLRIGKENAVKRKYLMEIFNISDRDLSDEIRKERMDGALIVPDGHGGLYIPDETTEEGQAEIKACQRRLYKIGHSTIAIGERVGKRQDGN